MVNPVPAATVYEDSFWITGDNWLYSLELQSFAVEYNRRMTMVGQPKVEFPHVGTGNNLNWFEGVAGISPIKVWQEALKAIYDEYVDWKNGAMTYDQTHYIDATHYGTIRWTTGADAATVTNWSSLGTTAVTHKKIYDALIEAQTAIDGMYASHPAWGFVLQDVGFRFTGTNDYLIATVQLNPNVPITLAPSYKDIALFPSDIRFEMDDVYMSGAIIIPANSQNIYSLSNNIVRFTYPYPLDTVTTTVYLFANGVYYSSPVSLPVNYGSTVFTYTRWDLPMYYITDNLSQDVAFVF